jgi:ATP synthase protein I
MKRAVLYQFAATLLVTLAAAGIAGQQAALSALAGGLSSLLPNLLFALRLGLVINRPGASYPVNFFIGEFVKIAATIGILAIVIRSWPEVHWPSLLLGLAVVLHASFFAFWKKS